MLDGNRENVAKAVMKHLDIPSTFWDDAVEPRPLHIPGEARPWSVTIAALTGEANSIFTNLFGDDHKKTHAIYLEVPVYNDVKRRRLENVCLEIEVGAAGQYNSFKQLGGASRLVVPEGSELGGTMLTCTLDQQTKSWPYHDPEWQAASNTYMHH